ncbi:tRNA methyltransferase complex GCD14 subunit [Pseudovirgaria hyperparasitica]|uniref:tRNA (adenine(58)-N(1))-methyltransferase catalytic subunit TRM61 n=1 Tax=Pseudovirgaria hyperparasitica TaxID=470096 RepID=A0A6A6VTP9_9PEZI|nr:tRNA methyltransferase complex GCD14 subunit [Pseudovirgaria hyperparasitica]KAF2753952.1 tRNA methyltransferase complex GCD14 subunit [Pseudovirgaria hyperparasitica]
MPPHEPSPFLDPGPSSTPSTLGIIHLKRDLLVPTILSTSTPSATSDYAEGIVTNTRFGSFPHSTLLHIPWGTQVRASKVDTGSRGNRDKSSCNNSNHGKKRKRGAGAGAGRESTQDADGEDVKAAVVASTGFAHLLPPTPEAWTLSLPHRTQVVYTPDYSYVLQRLRVRPGDTLIEAGAGSGSFSHAAARAVFNGYPWESQEPSEDTTQGAKDSTTKPPTKKKKPGKVYSFEYHEPRATKLREEIKDHGLDSIIRVTHRDVYQDGFCLPPPDNNTTTTTTPKADAIFLDLPAPWLALKHLTRTSTSSTPSPLNPLSTTRICTFSPCIEQVTKTAAALRAHGWTDIDMLELAHRRIDVRRERVGLAEEGLRGSNASPATVHEALGRMRVLEARHQAHRAAGGKGAAGKGTGKGKNGEGKKMKEGGNGKENGKGEKKKGTRDVDNHEDEASPNDDDAAAADITGNTTTTDRKLWKEGRLVHRTETELKTHTSYLLFAVLPREWTAADEARCARRWPVGAGGGGAGGVGGGDGGGGDGGGGAEVQAPQTKKVKTR